MKWAIYVRRACKDKSLSALLKQESMARKALDKRDNVYRVYRDDGYSGNNLNRPGLKQLLKDAKERKFEGVIVSSADRLSRSCMDVAHLVLDVFKRCNLALKSIAEQFDTSKPCGRMKFMHFATLADYQREVLRERIKEGKRRSRALAKIG